MEGLLTWQLRRGRLVGLENWDHNLPLVILHLRYGGDYHSCFNGETTDFEQRVKDHSCKSPKRVLCNQTS